MFKISNLTKKFKLEKDFITVFEDLSFSIESGEWISLTGSSGCGKTTLLHLLGGLDKPTNGQILFKDQRFSNLSPASRAKLRRKNIGFVFQSFNLFPELSALENVTLPARIAGVTLTDAKAKELLDHVGLSHRLKHRPAELSGGEQQRVAIARAFIGQPKILFADEPTGNLDAANSGKVEQLLFDLNKQNGTTLVLVTHDDELAARCQRQLRMHAGELSEVVLREAS